MAASLPLGIRTGPHHPDSLPRARGVRGAQLWVAASGDLASHAEALLESKITLGDSGGGCRTTHRLCDDPTIVAAPKPATGISITAVSPVRGHGLGGLAPVGFCGRLGLDDRGTALATSCNLGWAHREHGRRRRRLLALVRQPHHGSRRIQFVVGVAQLVLACYLRHRFGDFDRLLADRRCSEDRPGRPAYDCTVGASEKIITCRGNADLPTGRRCGMLRCDLTG